VYSLIGRYMRTIKNQTYTPNVKHIYSYHVTNAPTRPYEHFVFGVVVMLVAVKTDFNFKRDCGSKQNWHAQVIIIFVIIMLKW
jgi:hypothetical protein